MNEEGNVCVYCLQHDCDDNDNDDVDIDDDDDDDDGL